MYAEDAQVSLLDRLAPPSAPRILRGRNEIRQWIEEVCGRDMTHRVRHCVQDQGGVAFTEDCRYPDGKAVVCSTVLEVRDGLITRQVGVQVWDE